MALYEKKIKAVSIELVKNANVHQPSIHLYCPRFIKLLIIEVCGIVAWIEFGLSPLLSVFVLPPWFAFATLTKNAILLFF